MFCPHTHSNPQVLVHNPLSTSFSVSVFASRGGGLLDSKDELTQTHPLGVEGF